MKFITTKQLFATIATFTLILNLVSCVSIRKVDAEKTLEDSNEERRAHANHIFKPQLNPPFNNKTNTTLGLMFNAAVNNSAQAVNMKEFVSVNSNSKFHALFDKQLEEIFLIFKNKKMAGVSDFRTTYALFIKNFDACDKNHDLHLSKAEFSACMTSDPYLSIVQPPQHIYSVMRNYTNATGYNNDIYDFANNYDVNGLNFYDYVIIRLFTFAWRKCTVVNNSMDESTFECAVDIVGGTKGLNTNTLRTIFQHGLKLVNSKSMPVRTFDFLTFYALASSIKLFAKINAKLNFDATMHEFNIALDTNVLPTRYNQDIINQLFRLTKKDSSSRNGIDLITFVFYDHFLKLFYQGANINRWTITSNEFSKICTGFLFPKTIYNYMTQVPLANFTHNDYNLRSHINLNQLDEEDNFSKFLQIKSSSVAGRYNNTALFDSKKVDARIFKLLDSDSNNVLTFYDFANFVQTFVLYQKTDARDADRVIVSDLAQQFTHYNELPLYSTEFRARSNRFNLLEQDMYIDPFFALAITRMDDYVHHYLRRSDPTTVKELELNLILERINLGNFPTAFLTKCARGKDSNGIPKYDWECSIINAIDRALSYLENTRDLKDMKSHGFNLTYTQIDYAHSK